MAKSRSAEENSLSGWAEIIRQMSDQSHEREKLRKEEAERFFKFIEGMYPVDRLRELLKACDCGLINLNEYFAQVRLVLDVPAPE